MGRGSGAGGGGAGRARAGASGVPVHSQIPNTAAGLARTVSAASLAHAETFDQGLHEHFSGLANGQQHLAQVEQLRQTFRREGQPAVDRMNARHPIKVAVSKTGKMEVLDGRHRILAMQSVPGLKVRVKFVRGT